ncbi:HAD family phosphatase [Saccharopolyspora sp. NPDC050389]|uniref:HAD family hydrolase n=1 Tax=Saccharopolyspora sp. NPDC050389 TaxID=3155516 RepID=UPI0033C50CE4
MKPSPKIPQVQKISTSPIAGIIFNLDDDVLINFGSTWGEIWHVLLTLRGHRRVPDDSVEFQGSRQWLERLAALSRGLDPTEVEEWCTDYAIRALATGSLCPRSGSTDLVSLAAGRLPVALVSSAPRRFVEAAISAFEWGQYFTATVHADEIPDARPCLDMYALAASRLGVDPQHCLAVENSCNRISIAQAANMEVLSMPKSAYPLEPDGLVTQLRTLLATVSAKSGFSW